MEFTLELANALAQLIDLLLVLFQVRHHGTIDGLKMPDLVSQLVQTLLVVVAVSAANYCVTLPTRRVIMVVVELHVVVMKVALVAT